MPQATAPHSAEAERAILGVLLLDNRAWDQAAALSLEDFFLHSHQVIFATIKELLARDSAVDLVTLAEALAEHGELEKVGGAAYLSQLTDGQPKLANIGHYVAIVQKKAHLRRTMAAGIALTEHPEQADVAAALAQAAHAVASDNGTQAGAEAPAVDKYPNMPEGAWCDLARVYYEAIRHSTSASGAYHLAIFLAAAGTMLARTCFFRLPKPRFANFYVALVGRAGKAKKGTAMDYGVDLLQAVAPDIPWLSSVDSAEGFVEFLVRNQKAQERKDSPGLLYFSELRGLVEKASKEGGRNIMPKLAEAFDCGDRIEVGTRNNPLRANLPFVSVFGGASPTWLDRLTLSDLEGGIGSRFIWIPANPIMPYEDPPPYDQHRWNSVVHSLHQMREHYQRTGPTEFRFTPAAKRRWTPFFKNLYRMTADDPLVEIMAERMDLYCRKVAMVHAAIERSPGEIDVAHLEPAIAFTEFLVRCLYSIFGDFGLSDALKDQRAILEAVRKAMPAGISKRLLQKKLWRMDAETFNRRLRWMVGEDTEIRLVPVGRSQYLFLRDWAPSTSTNVALEGGGREPGEEGV
jgi:hypothetical protein